MGGCKCSQRPGSARSAGTGVIGGYEPLYMGVEK